MQPVRNIDTVPAIQVVADGQPLDVRASVKLMARRGNAGLIKISRKLYAC